MRMSTWKWAAALLAATTLSLFALPAHAYDRRDWVIFDASTNEPAGNDTTALGMADSSRIIFTGSMQRLYLHLLPNRPCIVAIQVTEHGDTLGTSGAVSLGDTTKTAVWPWRSISFADSNRVVLSDNNNPSAIAAGSDELTVVFQPSDVAQKWGVSRGKYIGLHGADGVWYTGENTRIRLRVIGGVAAGGTVRWTKAVLKGYTWGN